MPTQVPTGIQAGLPGSLWSAPETITLDHGESYVIPAGEYYLYATGNDVDLEIITATVPTWTKIRDGTVGAEGQLIESDGESLRLKNTHVATDDETAKLIQVS